MSRRFRLKNFFLPVGVWIASVGLLMADGLPGVSAGLMADLFLENHQGAQDHLGPVKVLSAGAHEDPNGGLSQGGSLFEVDCDGAPGALSRVGAFELETREGLHCGLAQASALLAQTHEDPQGGLSRVGSFSVDAHEDIQEGSSQMGPFSVEKASPDQAQHPWKNLAQGLSPWRPLLILFGFLLLMMELKAPGVGVFGILGVTLMSVVFGVQHVVGTAALEGAFAFCLGLILLGVEVWVLPGMWLLGMIGFGLMTGSLVWSLLDLRPQDTFSWSLVWTPAAWVLGAWTGALLIFLILLRYFPGSWVYARLVLKTQNRARATGIWLEPGSDRPTFHQVKVGTRLEACTDLSPGGEVQSVDDPSLRYPALSTGGFLKRTTLVRVIGHRDFELLVEPFADQSEQEGDPDQDREKA